uniref:Ig-like domain-containing protein n=1 Tax=Cyprinus carpio carpio TaxID=630221 RepID=A0A8C1E8H1_CYPCA
MQEGSLSLTPSFRIFYLRLLGFCFLYFSSVAGTQAECPVQLSQQRVVVRYNGSVAVNCNTSITHKGMGWEASEGAVPMTRDKMITWRVSHLTEWDIEPFCFINHEEQCQVQLLVTIYKTPDSVSISIVDHSGPMIEGQQYKLQCDVHDVAPVQNLTVKWYKGQTLLDKTTFTEDSKTPLNETATLLIRPDRADDGAQYSCAAELELGAEGPQPPPNKTSESLSFTVYFKPIIDENKLPSIVPVFRGYPEVLVCEAEGNPKPTISWILGTNVIVYNETLTISESTPEHVYCIADNSAGRTTRQVNVSIQDISISTVSHTGPMIAGEWYELQCFIQNVVFKIVDVRWYKLNQINVTETIKTPANLTYKVRIRPDRADDGAQFWCEAKLEAKGPQRYSTMSSDHLSITVHSKPIIDENKLPSIVPVFRGNPEVLVCEAEGNPKPTISWILGTNVIVYNETLTISESTPEHVYCVANNSVGRTTRQVNVSIQDISISTVSHTGPMIAGEWYELQCFIQNVVFKIVDVRWYKLNQINVTETIKTPANLTYKVRIRPDRADDGAQFWCEAKLEAKGPQRYSTMSSDHLSITVHFKPIIDENKLPSIVPVFRGYPEVLVCEAEGNPKPTISWILGTNVIVYNESLTISESTPEHVYCVANNSVGRTTRQVNVSIQDISISTVSHTGPMIAGEWYELQCFIQNVVFKIVDVRWYKLNQINVTETIKTPANLTYKVRIRPDRADDGAQFWCEAKLEAKGPQRYSTMSSDHLSITVNSKPIIDENKLPSIVPVFRGYPEVLVCEAEGNPKPTISWILGTNVIVYNETLTISESTPEHVYCVANNSAGRTTRQVNVSIQDISISTVSHTGPMIAGEWYELQCFIQNVVFKIVDVRWYKLNQINVTETIKTPANLTYKVRIRPDRADDGAQFWCEAKLEAKGPQRYSTMSSDHLSITVHFKPIIDENKLPSIVPVFRGNPEVLVCEAEGNPKPTISWILGTNVIVYNESLTISESTPEHVYCVANNSAGRTTRQVNVSIQENYIPIILGIIVAVVVAISVIFIFIYIYLTNYKKTKTGHYDVKEANAHKELLAQTVPMKELCQSNMSALVMTP